ncbi:Protein NHR-1 d [Aphelenchoides avenae]|nr:Protein NHR-1 d [Aphelenchus avenae]
MYSPVYAYDQACGYDSLPQIVYSYPGLFEPQQQLAPAQVASASGPMKRQKRRRVSEDEPCLVCGGKATAYHYGVASCHSCKAFFRRSILSGQQFTCQYDGNCDITPSELL